MSVCDDRMAALTHLATAFATSAHSHAASLGSKVVEEAEGREETAAGRRERRGKGEESSLDLTVEGGRQETRPETVDTQSRSSASCLGDSGTAAISAPCGGWKMSRCPANNDGRLKRKPTASNLE